MRDNWKIKSVRQIGEVISGGTPSTGVSEYWDGEIVWVTPADLSKLRFAKLETSSKKITNEGLNNSSANLISKGSVIISSRAPIGYFAVPVIDFATNQGCKSIRLFDGNDSLFHYYNFLFNVEVFKRRGEGTTFAEISKKEVEKLSFSVPPLPHQRKIARILSTCDTVIEKTEAAIAKYQAIKQGMMHDLFTRGINLTTGQLRPPYQDAPELYKETELGWLPKEWEVKKLNDATEKIGSGVTPTGGSEVYQNSGILFIRSQNVLRGALSLEDVAYISKEIDERMASSRVLPYDVLLNITGASIGRCAFFPKELTTANVNQHVCIIRFSKLSKEKALFISEYLNSDFGQRQILRFNAGGNREGLNFQQLGSFSIPDIQKEEISLISKKIYSLNNKLLSEQSALTKYRQLKAGLMQDLLTGKVEVNVEEEKEAFV